MHKPKHWERGQSLVEMTVVTVVLIILLGGLFDIGRSFIILVAVENATGEGALYGASRPNCLLDVAGECNGNLGVVERVREEGQPIVNLTETNSTIVAEIDGGGSIAADSTLRVDVTYTYSPLTPIGFLIWGDTATVTATARQIIMSPPRPW